MRKRLGEILIAAKVIRPEQLQQILTLQAQIRQPVGRLLISQGLTTEEQVAQALAEQRWRGAEAEQAAERLLAVRPAAEEHAERVRPRILIVEDHPINLELMMELLERGGYELYACKDGREVMAQAKAHQPDLILLDINLPHIDGLTLAQMLREDPETRSVVIVAVSAYSVVGDEERIRRAGCDGFIPKPIDTKSFLRTVSTYLNRDKAG